MSKVNNKTKKHHNYLTPYQPSPFKKTINSNNKNKNQNENILNEPIFKKPKFVHILPSESELNDATAAPTTDTAPAAPAAPAAVATPTCETDVVFPTTDTAPAAVAPTTDTDTAATTDTAASIVAPTCETDVVVPTQEITVTTTEQNEQLIQETNSEKTSKESFLEESDISPKQLDDKTAINNEEPKNMAIEDKEIITSLVTPTETGESLFQIVLNKLSNLLSFLNRN